MSKRYFAVLASLLIIFIILGRGTQLNGQDEHHPAVDTTQQSVETDHVESGHAEAATEEFNATESILEHISDSHEWHLFTTKEGKHVSIPLPVILYSKHSGLHIFSSRTVSSPNFLEVKHHIRDIVV